LLGTFTDGVQAWRYSARLEGDNLVFIAGSFTSTLSRQNMPKLDGVYVSKRVKVQFKNKDAGINGVITFNSRQYQFTACEVAGDLEGIFQAGNEEFKFSLANDPRGLFFQTGTFYEQLHWSQRLPIKETANNVRWTNSLGMILVKVPGTRVMFSIWHTRKQDYALYAKDNENVDNSWRTVEYDDIRVSDGPTHPVTMVSWYDAKAFCDWLTTQERADGVLTGQQFYRLPTDAEWSVAVGLGTEEGNMPIDKDGKITGVYPWGNQWPPPNDAGNYDDFSTDRIFRFHDGFPRTSPVGSFKPNKLGLYDMGGNLWQWCEDWYDGQQRSKVLRGGSWGLCGSVNLLSSFRYDYPPDSRYFNNGFRIVLVGGK
jgi:hypothetical protein